MRLLALALLLLASCGAPGPEAQVGFELYLSRATADLVSGLQVAVVTNGRSLDCLAVQKSCLSAQVDPPSRLLKLADAPGSGRAMVFPLSLNAGSQDLALEGIPPGKDLAVVIEALSKTNPPTLVGSSCNYVQEIASGRNERLIAATITPLSTPPACDPRL